MNLNLSNLKVILGVIYLVIISAGLFLLFSTIDPQDLMSYEFIKSNKDIFLQYKNENLVSLTVLFFIFCIIWVLLLGFALPLLLFSGFIFGKWWGTFIVLTSTTIGATALYILVGFFFRDLIEKYLKIKFSKLVKFLKKNDTIYFMIYRSVGGGGAPYPIQNILPILFNMPVKNYVIATFVGSLPAMFITVSIGSGLENILNKNEKITFFSAISSPEIYIPVVSFFIILIIAFFVKKKYLKK